MREPRRLLSLLIVVAAIAVPAVVLRGLCIGEACDDEVSGSRTPFCSLPDRVRTELAAGFRDGRSPDVLVVTERPLIAGSTLRGQSDTTPWPSVEPRDQTRVPIVFHGTRVSPGVELPAGTGVDDVAPTIAAAIGLDRPHPEVRSGQTVPGVASPVPTRLVVIVVWKGVDSDQIGSSRTPNLSEFMDAGAATLDGATGSLPVDPTAVLATIGTGGLPRQHGTVASYVRNDRGEVVRPWSPRAPVSVIAALGDDLDQSTRQSARVGLIADSSLDTGVIGGNWYLDNDTDDVVITSGGIVTQVEKMLANGYGDDEITDLLAVTSQAPLDDLDDELGELIRATNKAVRGGLLVVMTATGSDAGPQPISASELVQRIETEVPGPDIVDAAIPGGLYLDQRTLAAGEIAEDDVVRVLRGMRAPQGTAMFVDVFSSTAISFARYC